MSDNHSKSSASAPSVTSHFNLPEKIAGEPSPPDIDHLLKLLADYLNAAEVEQICLAYQFSERIHAGQLRRSGDPYISHPIAVATICADWKLDAQAIMAALLHDVIEDQGVLLNELAERFGQTVANLVDGLSKLEKIHFQNQADAQVENFRKMILAMARDVRVILVKLADRLHNMRTLEVMKPEKQRRIARETMDVYVPIAHRLGLNDTYLELQDLSFFYLYPLRYRTLKKAIASSRGNRRALVDKILEAVKSALEKKLQAQIYGREKTLYGIYHKMQEKHLSFSQVLDVYGFRIVVDSMTDCYVALGLLHSLYKPIPGKFKDYIAIPKINAYQSLHTTLIGPYGTPIEFQIRTHNMHRIAEAGVAAHWMYKSSDSSFSEVEQRTHAWLQSLLEIQTKTGDSKEFWEHVQFDLFHDSVYVFTPKAQIITLPRGATALDFAYAIHTDIGDQAVSAVINHESTSLRSTLHSGDIVEIKTSLTVHPTPHSLTFVYTAKARAAIRHYLRTTHFEETIVLGEGLLKQALIEAGITDLIPDVLARFLREMDIVSIRDLYADIGTGNRMAILVAHRLAELSHSLQKPLDLKESSDVSTLRSPAPIVINGPTNTMIRFASCCKPIPDDAVIGQIQKDQGLIVHRENCRIAKRLRTKNFDYWVDVVWGHDIQQRFAYQLKLTAYNVPGVLAQIAAEFAASGVNVTHINMDEDPRAEFCYVIITIQVSNRQQVERLTRNLRRVKEIVKVGV